MKDQKKADELLEESLVLERAWARLTTIISKLRIEKERDKEDRKANGEKPDKSYEVLLSGLEALQDTLRCDCDALFEQSRKHRVPFNPGYKLLLNQIVVTAAEDYEYAISGDRNESEAHMIEEFGDIVGTRVANILKKLGDNQTEFSMVAKRDADEIIAETRMNRKRGIPLERNTHKCPNCGGSLYSTKEFGSHRICCTRCRFFEVIKDD